MVASSTVIRLSVVASGTTSKIASDSQLFERQAVADREQQDAGVGRVPHEAVRAGLDEPSGRRRPRRWCGTDAPSVSTDQILIARPSTSAAGRRPGAGCQPLRECAATQVAPRRPRASRSPACCRVPRSRAVLPLPRIRSRSARLTSTDSPGRERHDQDDRHGSSCHRTAAHETRRRRGRPTSTTTGPAVQSVGHVDGRDPQPDDEEREVARVSSRALSRSAGSRAPSTRSPARTGLAPGWTGVAPAAAVWYWYGPGYGLGCCARIRASTLASISLPTLSMNESMTAD